MNKLLNRKAMRSLALETVTEFRTWACDRWFYYPSHILRFWTPDTPLAAVIAALQADGDHTLARILDDVGYTWAEKQAVKPPRPGPTDRVSQQELRYQLRDFEGDLNLEALLRRFWTPDMTLAALLERLRGPGDADEYVGRALARTLQAGLRLIESGHRVAVPGRVAAPGPRTLSEEQAVAAARDIADELWRAELDYTTAEVLSFWTPATPAPYISRAMHEAGEHTLAMLFEELVLVGAELNGVLAVRRPTPDDRLSRREMQRVYAVMRELGWTGILPLWDADRAIKFISRDLACQYGPDAQREFLYWALYEPGYCTTPPTGTSDDDDEYVAYGLCLEPARQIA